VLSALLPCKAQVIFQRRLDKEPRSKHADSHWTVDNTAWTAVAIAEDYSIIEFELESFLLHSTLEKVIDELHPKQTATGSSYVIE